MFLGAFRDEKSLSLALVLFLNCEKIARLWKVVRDAGRRDLYITARLQECPESQIAHRGDDET
jgi:hypothetical protein